LAVLLGNTEIAAAGALPVTLNPMEAFVAACMRTDRNTIDWLSADDATLAEQVFAILPELIIRATELNRPETVRLMAAFGFDVTPAGTTAA
jgi:hypothetical protein